MKHNASVIYDFVLRGLLTEDALDAAGRTCRAALDMHEAEVASTLSLDLLDDDHVADARKMSIVYAAVASFENSVRDLIQGILLEAKGEGWWKVSVPEKVRNRAEKRQAEEEKVRWHTQRGADPIKYTTMPDLIHIMRKNFDLFEPYVKSIDWVANVFDAIERSRNVIMHSGSLDKGDVERLGIFIRDWIKQVGT